MPSSGAQDVFGPGSAISKFLRLQAPLEFCCTEMGATQNCCHKRQLQSQNASVKRALKLDSFSMTKRPRTSLESMKKNHKPYSPTTGTRSISPFSSPRSNNVQEQRNGLSNGCRKEVHGLLKSSSKKGQPEMEKSVKFLVAKPSADDSVERFLQLRQKLTSLQALEGTRELENIISVSDNSCNLKSEVRKNRELKCHRPVNSFKFLKSLIE
ncbi:centromere protein R isoform X2 [Sphaerodactylus townsendi]|uniref:centromere protein R isoform X2 n=1 Tax=Sphaerodactylus townsendi TaxID=933632 RepID=UPI0020261FF3|nr:centromere protein R isoform X2 [Sphaerodactylus townsendi]